MKKSLSVAMGATFLTAMAASPIASADTNPFGMQNLESGYLQVAEGKCGEGKEKAKEAKCGGEKAKEAKCGGEKAKEAKCGGEKAKEAKCGEGKCGEGMENKSEKAKEAKCGEGKCGGKE